jgi:glucosamine--fructose-6-phosphate aminotransferase (isomerizing)
MDTRDHTLIAARNGSPLVVGFGSGENFLASDAAALLPHTKMVHFLEDDQMAIIGANAIMLFNAKTGEHLQPRKQRLTWNVSDAEKGDYPFFMLKEIYEQPGVVSDIAANAARIETHAAHVKKSRGTYLVGCGTASYAAVAGEYLFSKIAKRHVNVAIGSEFGYHLDFLNRDSLVIAISQSGETMDILESVKKASHKGAKILALVNVLGSTLYREADYKLLIDAGPEKGVASTKAFIGMLAHLTLLAFAVAGKTADGVAVLTKAVLSMKKVLSDPTVKKITDLAEKLKKKEHIYVIGRGLSYPTALETALKIKEISYIHAEGLAAGELKHGPLALVTRGTPCIAFLPDDETYGANLAGAMEMKARGGFVIGISHKPHEVFDEYIRVEDAKEATIIPNVLVGQLLAYYLTLERRLDPDMPRNLAKSVTVK